MNIVSLSALSEQNIREIWSLVGAPHATLESKVAWSAGVEVISAEPGRVELSLARKPELLQFNNFFHGGVVSGLADHAAAAAARKPVKSWCCALKTPDPSGNLTRLVSLHRN